MSAVEQACNGYKSNAIHLTSRKAVNRF